MGAPCSTHSSPGIAGNAPPSAAGNMEFLGALAQALAALLVSALILIADYATFSPDRTIYSEAASKKAIQARRKNS
jgi:hypothetical protein